MLAGLALAGLGNDVMREVRRWVRWAQAKLGECLAWMSPGLSFVFNFMIQWGSDNTILNELPWQIYTEFCQLRVLILIFMFLLYSIIIMRSIQSGFSFLCQILDPNFMNKVGRHVLCSLIVSHKDTDNTDWVWHFTHSYSVFSLCNTSMSQCHPWLC